VIDRHPSIGSPRPTNNTPSSARDRSDEASSRRRSGKENGIVRRPGRSGPAGACR